MWIKDLIKKDFWNNDKLILKRFKSSKLIFVWMSFLFFLNYFLLSNFPENSLFVVTLPSIYIWFILSILLITFYSVKIYFKNKFNTIIYIVFWIFLTIILTIFSIPFLIDSKTLSNLI